MNVAATWVQVFFYAKYGRRQMNRAEVGHANFLDHRPSGEVRSD